jgi:hypothetical protein
VLAINRRVDTLNASLFESKPVLSLRGKGRLLQFVFNTNLLTVNPDLVLPVQAKVDLPNNPVMAMAKSLDGSAPPASPPYPGGPPGPYPPSVVPGMQTMFTPSPVGVVNPYLMPAALPGTYAVGDSSAPGTFNPYMAPTAVPGAYAVPGAMGMYPAGIYPAGYPAGGAMIGNNGMYVDAAGNPLYPAGGVYAGGVGPAVYMGGGAPAVYMGGTGFIG